MDVRDRDAGGQDWDGHEAGGTGTGQFKFCGLQAPLPGGAIVFHRGPGAGGRGSFDGLCTKYL